MTGRVPCPQCAELILPEALLCRFCGTALSGKAVEPPRAPPLGYKAVTPAAPEAAAKLPAARQQEPDRLPLILGSVAAGVVLLGLLVWPFLPPTTPQGIVTTRAAPSTTVAAPTPEAPLYPPLAAGETLSWTAATATDDVERQVGPLAIRVSRIGSGEEVAPMVEVSYDGAAVRLEGERVGPTYEHRITAVQNRAGAAPVVMLQSYSGGAHCCNRIQLAGLSGGRLTVVDLGGWDGDTLEPPSDISGDGVADFVLIDQAFLYTFAPYAMSESVPKVLNVVGGKVVDVSTRPAFRRLFAEAATRTGEKCRADVDGVVRNGACAAYVAAAARTGRLATAWAEMLGGYDATTDWQLPTGCAVAPREGACPVGQELQFQSYPEALLAFLKRQGYVAKGWQPPEARTPLEPPQVEPELEDEPAV